VGGTFEGLGARWLRHFKVSTFRVTQTLGRKIVCITLFVDSLREWCFDVIGLLALRIRISEVGVL
jgi:hypothetical protein